MFSEPPDASAIFQEGVPRKTGVWGWGDCERPRSARRSPETYPRAFLVPFWASKKELAPQGGTVLKSGSDAERHSHTVHYD